MAGNLDLSHKPLSPVWEDDNAAKTRAILPTEIEKLADRLSGLGIEQARVGLEFEFSLPETPPNESATWQKAKSRILSDLGAQIDKAPRDEKAALEAKRDAVAAFNAREILMYELLEDDARKNGYLEPLFGSGHDGNGYYDGENMLELKMAHCDVRAYLERKEKILRALSEKAESFGLPLSSRPNTHINLSFWKNGQNLFLPDHPEFSTTGKALVEGMTRALYDSVALMTNQNGLDTPTDAFCYSPSRASAMRSAYGRYEILFGCVESKQRPDLITTLGLAGALYGLIETDRAEIAEARVVKSPLIGRPKNKYKLLTHALNGARLNDDGTLTFSQDYLSNNAGHLAYELGLVQAPPSGYEQMLFIIKSLSSNYIFRLPIVNFMDCIQIDPAKNRISWPTTEPNVFVSKTPEKNMHLLPEDMQERMRRGEKLSTDEMDPYVAYGDTYPSAGRTVRIDVSLLKKEIRLRGVTEKLAVLPGYDMTRAERYLSLGETRIKRLKTSKALHKTLSSALMNALLEDNLSAPEPCPTRNDTAMLTHEQLSKPTLH
ncbi:MAG: hypothetical protein PHE27_03105 [Alphaproteobacteria bacterium]|nr:hypothetical protein [Alphaproteobacteria bacterium]